MGRVHVPVDPGHFHPTKVELRVGDPTKAKEKLGRTHSVKLSEMNDAGLAAVKTKQGRKTRQDCGHGGVPRQMSGLPNTSSRRRIRAPPISPNR